MALGREYKRYDVQREGTGSHGDEYRRKATRTTSTKKDWRVYGETKVKEEV